jgi:hypothetical protein
VDVDLDEFFVAMSNTGMTYARYIDYLRGRTLFHVVVLPKATTRVEMKTSSQGGYQTALGKALSYAVNNRPKVVINGGYFDSPGFDASGAPCVYVDMVDDYIPLLYRWPRTGYATSVTRPCSLASGPTDTTRYPVLGITGTSTNQSFQIVKKHSWLGGSDWKPQPSGWPIWDTFPLFPGPDGVSDVDYAIQSYPSLVENSALAFFEGGDPTIDASSFYARTAVGVLSNGSMVMVVADGEGLINRQGANFYTLARFLKDALNVKNGMALDGGGSTSMVIWRDSLGLSKFINIPTSETYRSTTAPTGLLDFMMGW